MVDELQHHDQVDKRCVVPNLRMGMPEPVGQNAVFGYPVQHAVGADDGGVDRAGKNQRPDEDHEGVEKQPQAAPGPTRYMASPPMRLSRYLLRSASGMIMTAKNDTSEVNSRL